MSNDAVQDVAVRQESHSSAGWFPSTAVEITPAFQPGLEAFVRAEYTSPKITPRPFNLGPHLYVGPTVLSQFGRLWWTVGAYARLTDHSRSQQVGDTYGNYWLRSVVGYDL